MGVNAMSDRFRMLYDGSCPMCSREVMNLYRRRPDAIEPVDISAEDFDAAAWGLEGDQVQSAMYGIRPDGSITVGMESLREGYRLAGLGWILGWTQWWPARPVFDVFYSGFARTRMRISKWLGRCDGHCRV